MSDEPMSIRRAEESDADVLSAIAAEAYGTYVDRIGRPPAPMLADYSHVIATATVWIARIGDRPVGFVVTKPAPDYLLLENVAVLPGEQGRGIGALLLRQAESDAADAQVTEVRLYTNEAMTENLAYYVRHGYRETHRATEDGYRRVFFRKLLSGG